MKAAQSWRRGSEAMAARAEAMKAYYRLWILWSEIMGCNKKAPQEILKRKTPRKKTMQKTPKKKVATPWIALWLPNRQFEFAGLRDWWAEKWLPRRRDMSNATIYTSTSQDDLRDPAMLRDLIRKACKFLSIIAALATAVSILKLLVSLANSEFEMFELPNATPPTCQWYSFTLPSIFSW